MAKGSLAKAPWLTQCLKSRFFSSYYVLNIVFFLTYFFGRLRFWDSPVFNKREMYSFFLTREEQIFGILGVTFLLKVRYLVTPDMLWGQFFGFYQVGLLIITLGVSYIWFALSCLFALILYLFVPQPAYIGPAKIERLNDRDFEKLVENGSPKESWVILFYAHWAHNCNQFMVLFSELSLLFGSDHLKFGKVNAAYSGHLSMKYNISLQVTTKQLPTVILFQHGKEVCRTPEINSEGKINKIVMSGENLVNLFDLKTLTKRPPKKRSGKKA